MNIRKFWRSSDDSSDTDLNQLYAKIKTDSEKLSGNTGDLRIAFSQINKVLEEFMELAGIEFYPEEYLYCYQDGGYEIKVFLCIHRKEKKLNIMFYEKSDELPDEYNFHPTIQGASRVKLQRGIEYLPEFLALYAAKVAEQKELYGKAAKKANRILQCLQ
jgi:hypothetical protein